MRAIRMHSGEDYATIKLIPETVYDRSVIGDDAVELDTSYVIGTAIADMAKQLQFFKPHKGTFLHNFKIGERVQTTPEHERLITISPRIVGRVVSFDRRSKYISDVGEKERNSLVTIKTRNGVMHSLDEYWLKRHK